MGDGTLTMKWGGGGHPLFVINGVPLQLHFPSRASAALVVLDRLTSVIKVMDVLNFYYEKPCSFNDCN